MQEIGVLNRCRVAFSKLLENLEEPQLPGEEGRITFLVYVSTHQTIVEDIV